MGINAVSVSTIAPPLKMGVRLSLSYMMFFQFAVWGAWFVVLGNYLTALKFTGTQIGSIYATMSLGAVFSPMFIGQIADRYFSSERLMGVLHLAGAGLLYCMTQITEPGPFTGSPWPTPWSTRPLWRCPTPSRSATFPTPPATFPASACWAPSAGSSPT